MNLFIFHKRIFIILPAQLITLLMLSFLPIFIAEAVEKESPQANPTVTMLEQKDQCKKIKINLGEVVGIKLKTQGGTGYQWHFDDSTFKHFELIEHKTESIFKDERTGGPVWGIWYLKSSKAGKGEIRMDYFRVWEGRANAQDHFTIKVNIEDNQGKP